MTIESFIGPVIQSKAGGELIVHKNVQIDVKDGKIESVVFNPKPKNDLNDSIKYLKDGQFLIPGFIDGHIHAAQLPNLGLGYDKPLLDWLDSYTFPLEKKYENIKFANIVYDAVVKKTLKLGTTTACYYASLHTPASVVLAEKTAKYGQRALIGKVSINNHNDHNYYENLDDSMNNTRNFIKEIKKMNNSLVQPIITPRFALSCSMQLMTMLADLAKAEDLYIQTHISENLEEVKMVNAMFPEHSSYAKLYDAAGLLTNKTILAHGIYLTDDEILLINKRKSAIIHCPLSNTNLKSGLCDIRKLQAANIKIGLGTDVSGGNFMSILDVMRAALQVSMHLSFIKPNYQPLNYKEVFYLATLGGAEALNMHDTIGDFQIGKEFDALIIDLEAPNSILDNLQDYSLEEKFQRFIYSGDDRNIAEVYVRGERVV